MIKRIGMMIVFVALLIVLNQIPYEIGSASEINDFDQSFIDDVGNKININQTITKVISLSPTHTENLFSIGAGDLLIGADVGSIYPYEAAMLPRYDLDKIMAIDAIILADPDLIFIEPRMNQNQTALVSALESQGMVLVSLMPESLLEFEDYIYKLGLCTNQEKEAVEKAKAFMAEINAYKATSENTDQSDVATVFIETSERGYETATKDSLVGQAVTMAGGKLLTPKTPWYYGVQDNIAAGKPFIMKSKHEIDVYMTLRGNGNSGATITSLTQRPEFLTIDAIDQDNVYEMSGLLLDRFTFRYLEGIKEIHRLLYGDIASYIDESEETTSLTRSVFARVLYEQLTLPTFTIIDKDYYDHEKYHHTYGSFLDVGYEDADFNVIETCVMYSYLLPIHTESQEEVFDREGLITEEDIRHFIYIWKNVKGEALDMRLKNENIKLSEIKTARSLIELLESASRWQDD